MLMQEISQCSFDRINNDCLLQVAQFLSPEDCAHLAATCRRLYQFITRQNRLFQGAMPYLPNHLEEGFAYRCFVLLKTGELSGCFKSKVVAGHQKGVVRCLVVLPDGIASGGDDNTIRVWANGREVSCLQGHLGPVMCLASQGDTIISGSFDHTIRVWADGRQVACLTGHRGPVRYLAVLGDRIISGGEDGTMRFWKDGAEERLLEIGFTCIATFQNRIVYGSLPNTIKLWEDGEEVEYSIVESTPLRLAVSGEKIICGFPQSIQVFERGKEVHCLRLQEETMTCMALSGSRIFSGSCKGMIRVWNGGSHELCLRGGHENWITSLVIFRNQIISASQDGTIRQWELDIESAKQKF